LRSWNGYASTGNDGTRWRRVNARCPYHAAKGDDAISEIKPKGPKPKDVPPELRCQVPGCHRIRAYLYANAQTGEIVRHPVCMGHRVDAGWRQLLPAELRVPQRKHLVRVARKERPTPVTTMPDPVEEFGNSRAMLRIDRTDLLTWYHRWMRPPNDPAHLTLDHILTLWERPNRASIGSQPRRHFRDTAQLKELFDWFTRDLDLVTALAQTGDN
jgi:hypothetical protein